MAIPLLRTLTLKSKLNFGKFAIITIQDIINLGENQYLRWIYCNYDNISFTDDILKKLGIITKAKDYSIEKPGKDENLLNTLNKWTEKVIPLRKTDKKLIKDSLKASKEKFNDFIESDKKYFSNTSLMRRNHGHR